MIKKANGRCTWIWLGYIMATSDPNYGLMDASLISTVNRLQVCNGAMILSVQWVLIDTRHRMLLPLWVCRIPLIYHKLQ